MQFRWDNIDWKVDQVRFWQYKVWKYKLYGKFKLLQMVYIEKWMFLFNVPSLLKCIAMH